jgi:hypothetical protein
VKKMEAQQIVQKKKFEEIMSKRVQFKSVSLSKPLHDAISQFIKEHNEYRSIADFVSEATRLRMQQLRGAPVGSS